MQSCNGSVSLLLTGRGTFLPALAPLKRRSGERSVARTFLRAFRDDRSHGRRSRSSKKPSSRVELLTDPEAWHAELIKRAPLKHTPPRFEHWLADLGQWEGLPTDLHKKMELFAELAMDTNARMNIISAASYEEFYQRHVHDSLSLLPFITQQLHAAAHQPADAPALAAVTKACAGAGQSSGLPAVGGRVMDVGTGGGLPGLVLACAAPHADFTLIDSVARKAAFVEVARRRLGLRNVRVVCGRAEELALQPAHRRAYSCVTARAVADLGQLVEWTAPLLGGRGALLAMKGLTARAELERARPAIRRAQLHLLPDTAGSEVWELPGLGSVLWLQRRDEGAPDASDGGGAEP